MNKQSLNIEILIFCKDFKNGRVVCYEKNKDIVLVQDIALKYQEVYDDGALLVFIQSSNEYGDGGVNICFIDSSNPFSIHGSFKQELNTVEYRNDHKKFGEILLHFTSDDKRQIKIYISDGNKHDIIDMIPGDFTIESQKEIKKIFPTFSLSNKSKIALFGKSYFFISLALFIIFVSTQTYIYNTSKAIESEQGKMSTKIYGVNRDIKTLENNKFIKDEEKILSIISKKIAK